MSLCLEHIFSRVLRPWFTLMQLFSLVLGMLVLATISCRGERQSAENPLPQHHPGTTPKLAALSW